MALTDNIISYWKLDESSGNASDSVGSNTATNTNVTYSSGKINNGAVFNGTDAKLALGSGVGTALSGLGAATFSCWIKPTNINKEQVLFNVAFSGDTAKILFEITSANKILLGGRTVSTDTFQSKTSSSAEISSGNWYHVVGIIDVANDSVKCYVNGSEISMTGTPSWTNTSWDNNSQSSGNGLGNDAGGALFDGQMDEVGYWGRALSSTEITRLYNSGNGLQYPFPFTFTISDTITGTETSTSSRTRLFSCLDTSSITDTFNSIRGYFFNILDQITQSEAVTLIKKWNNLVKTISSYSNQTKTSSTFTKQSKNSSSWTKQSKT